MHILNTSQTFLVNLRISYRAALERYFFVPNSYMPALAKDEDSLSHMTSASELLLPLASRIGR
jgi:hypothetical protein